MSRVLLTVNRDLRRTLARLGNANSDEMKAGARVLSRAWRKVLSVRGGGKPSAAGEAPRRQSGKLARSVATGVVGTKRRVAVLRFTGPLLEGGVNAQAGTAKTRKSGRGKGQLSGKAGRTLRIAPRPSRDRAIDAARDEMANVIASTARDRLGA